MVFTLDELREQIMEDVFLHADYFAETITYVPANGPPRTLNVHMTISTDVEIDQGKQTAVTSLEVLVSRITDVEENTRGHVKVAPTIGAKIMRSKDRDPIQEPYMYTSEVDSEHPHKWRLLFRRVRTISQGVQR